MMEEKMKRMRRARRKHSRWKRGCAALVLAADAATAKKVKDDANEEAAAQPGYHGAARLRSRTAKVTGISKGYEGDEKFEDGLMKQGIQRAMKAIRNSTNSDTRKAYETEWLMRRFLETGEQRRPKKWKTGALQPLASAKRVESKGEKGVDKVKDASVQLALKKAMKAKAKPAMRKRSNHK